MASSYRTRRFIAAIVVVLIGLVAISNRPDTHQAVAPPAAPAATTTAPAMSEVNTLATKGRAPKTGYARTQFGSGWAMTGGCDMRNIILQRDLQNETLIDACKVATGVLSDPYTGISISFQRGGSTSQLVQIDHVVSLSNAWQTGAQQLTMEQRESFANDPLNLLAVDGGANQQKSDGDAATWLPANTSFRCQYVARQVAVKKKYLLWLTQPEKEAIIRILQNCPDQTLPV